MRTVLINGWVAVKSLQMRNAVCAVTGPGDAVPAREPRRTHASPMLDSGVLFAGGSEVAIAHAGETYRLRLTRQNKLILTK